ncbi:hypothetical protein ABZP36_001920 [Zizania latifolia]
MEKMGTRVGLVALVLMGVIMLAAISQEADAAGSPASASGGADGYLNYGSLGKPTNRAPATATPSRGCKASDGCRG